MLSFDIQTFGCKVNSYDTGLLQQKLLKEGYEYNSKEPEVFILNTCAVTAQSTNKAIRWVRKKRRENPSLKIVLTGCAAQVDTEQLNQSGADLIVANSHKESLGEIIKNSVKGLDKARVFKSNIFKKSDLGYGGGEEFSHTRSFLKIQDGCDSFCTFCVIPFARGKSRSLSIESLSEKVFELYEKGVREVVLTGVHIGDYDGGEGFKLEDLVEHLLVKTPMPRFRLSSLEPIEITDRLLELYDSEAMCKHFHLSLQSLSTKVLKDMKRKYGASEILNTFEKIDKRFNRKAFVGMDVIAGFPTETKEDFLETYKNLKEYCESWSFIHVFSYSPRPGTYATKFKGHHRSEILNRSRRLRQLSELRYNELAQRQKGETKKVLVLKTEKTGLSRDYWKVDISQVKASFNEELEIKIKGYDLEKNRLY